MNNQPTTVPAKLIQALECYHEEWVSSFPSKEEAEQSHQFSKSFERQMKHLSHHPPKSGIMLFNTWGKRVACLVVAASVTVAAALFGVKAFRDPKVNFTIQTNPHYSNVLFDKNTLSSGEKEKLYIQQYYIPSDIPNGYKKTIDTQSYSDATMEWKNDEGKTISFNQMLNTSGLSALVLDTEGADKIDQVKIGDVIGLYFYSKDRGHVWWCTGPYIFSVSTPGTKDETLEVAKSLKEGKKVTSNPYDAPPIYDASPGPDDDD